MSRFLKSLDFFGITYRFTFNREEKYKHHIGGCFSIIFIILGIYFVYIIGNEMFSANRPNVIRYQSFKYNNSISPSVNYSFSFHEWNSDGIAKEIDPIENGYLSVLGYSYIDNASKELFNFNKKCTKEDFSYSQTTFDLYGLSKSYCKKSSFGDAKFNNIGTLEKSLNSPGFFIRFVPCTGSDKCKTTDEINSYFENSYISATIQSEFVVYSPTESLQSNDTSHIYIDKKVFNLNVAVSNDQFIKYQVYKILSDLNPFGFNPEEKTYQNLLFDQSFSKIRVKSNNVPFLSLNFYASPIISTISRRFMKITELLTQFGSLMMVFYSIIHYIIRTLYRARMKEIIMNRVFYLNSDEDKKIQAEAANKIIQEKNNINPFSNRDERIKNYESGLVKKAPMKYDKEKNIYITKDGDIKEKGNMYENGEYSINKPKNVFKKKNITTIQSMNNEEKQPLQSISPNIPNGKKVVKIDTVDLLRPLNEYESLLSTSNFEKSVYLLSMYDYFVLTCCCCLSGHRTRDIHNNYTKLDPIMSHYTDVLFHVKKTYDLEKLEYILFDKTQYAIFNSIEKIENPLKAVAKNRFSQFYRFIKNKRAQESLFKEYIKNTDQNKKKKNKLEKKLLELVKVNN